jgi:hypothetical protein
MRDPLVGRNRVVMTNGWLSDSGSGCCLRAADCVEVAGDEFVEWCSFGAGDFDDAVSRRRERHIGNDGGNVV